MEPRWEICTFEEGNLSSASFHYDIQVNQVTLKRRKAKIPKEKS